MVHRSVAGRIAMHGVIPILLAGTNPAPATDTRAPAPGQITESEAKMTEHAYVGMWVTDDGYVRQELLPNGRYDEARGSRRSAYRGRYEVRGSHIDYWDDTGFTADGQFVDRDTLHHGGMVFRRR
ncbi:Atu4866 domain-containing protein [Labrys sp. LIt4]|uniref:Atu4866 domain-containing protein n=1 Tax=Labrys sp. LIt4 TaxID=2821355 RepID=UPI001FD7E94A|nr:Atu4866 domain-containing protein [Labrys sp. LIt4]